MAKIGLKYPAYATLETTPKRGVIGKAVTANVSITVRDVKLYGDDAVAETDRSFQSGTVDLTVTELSDVVQAALLGHAYDALTGEMVAKASDISPYVKFGFYGRKRVDGVDKFRTVVLHKVQFGEPNDENETKGETLTFGTHTIQGTIMIDDASAWKTEKTVDTEALAISFINTELSIV